MGSFNLCDITSGRALVNGDPVVAFLVTQQDPSQVIVRHLNRCTLHPADRFTLQSLPIYGTYDDRSHIEVSDESQLSVQLVLEATMLETWEKFSTAAFESRDGVEIFGKKVFYGLAVMHESSFQQLTKRGRSNPGDAAIIGQMSAIASGYVELLSKNRAKLSAYTEARNQDDPQAKLVMDSFREQGAYEEVLRLSFDRSVAANGHVVADNFAIPDVAAFNQQLERRCAIGSDLRKMLQYRGLAPFGAHRQELDSVSQVHGYPEFISAMLDISELLNGLVVNGRALMPSIISHEHGNGEFVIARELASIESQSVGQLRLMSMNVLSEDGRDVTQMREHIAHLRAIADNLESELSHAME